MRVRIVGSGRAGSSFAVALSLVGFDVGPVLGRADDVRRASHGVDLLLLATPDADVADVAARVEPDEGSMIAHVSGSLGLAPLASHPRPAVIHPLVALPDAQRGARRLVGAWFGVAAAGDPGIEVVVDALEGEIVRVGEDEWIRYHAAAVIAANHLVALLGQVERLADGIGAPLEAYLALARHSLDDVAELGPRRALTGPVRRGDHQTVARHLAGLPSSERRAYEALSAEAARLCP